MSVAQRAYRWMVKMTPARISLLIMVVFMSLFIWKERRQDTVLDLIEAKAYDVRFQAIYYLSKAPALAFLSQQASDRIVIADIDNRTLEAYGWPFERRLWGDFLKKMRRHQPAVIAYDVVFETEGVYQGQRFINNVIEKQKALGMEAPPKGALPAPAREYIDKVGEFSAFLDREKVEADGDGILAAEVGKTDNVVLGYLGYLNPNETIGMTPEKIAADAELIKDASMSVDLEETVSWPDIINRMRKARCYYYGLRPPIARLAEKTEMFGSLISEIDTLDGTIRWSPMFFAITADLEAPTGENSYLFPSLSLAALAAYAKTYPTIDFGPFGVTGISVGKYQVPTDEVGRLIINWMGPSYVVFPHVSIRDILTDFKEPKTLPKDFNPEVFFKGKIVLVGSSGTAAHDMRSTPFGNAPGVEMHANVISNILENNGLVTRSWFKLFDLSFIIGVGIIFGLILPRLSALWGGALALAFFIGYGVFNVYLFLIPHLSFTIVFPLTEVLTIYIGVTLFRYATEEREKRFIKSTFEHYMSPAVIKDLMKNPKKLALGGEDREMTAFFSDIQSFSSFSEKMTTQQLVHFLNIYLTELCDIIFQHDGTVDKFEGDAIIAFFGAPIDLPDHAARACLCAAEIQARLDALRPQWIQEGFPEVRTRIGLNSGVMSVGNMGSRDRMDYTIMGNHVNLAARLESGAKAYKVYSMISEFTKDAAGAAIETRELDVIRVKGIEKPVRVFEILGKNGEVPEEKIRMARVFEEGIRLHLEQKFDAAIEKFKQAREIIPNDGPAAVFIDRCEEYKQNPPGPEWDGVYTMTSK